MNRAEMIKRENDYDDGYDAALDGKSAQEFPNRTSWWSTGYNDAKNNESHPICRNCDLWVTDCICDK